MKIICDKCGTAVDKNDSVRIEISYPFRLLPVGKDAMWCVCLDCGRKMHDQIRKYLGGMDANSKER